MSSPPTANDSKLESGKIPQMSVVGSVSQASGSRESELRRTLGFKDAMGLAIGNVIGTGVFLKAATMAQQTPSATLILLAWFASGVLSLLGALCYSELGSRFPRAGGEYVYLKEAYGDLVAFLFGWMRFWIGSPGSIAAYSVGAATFLSSIVAFPTPLAKSICAVSLILGFTLLNCLKVSLGATVQNGLTSLKVFTIIVLSSAIYLFGASWSAEHPNSGSHFWNTPSAHWTGWSAFGTAMLASLWAYDGWNNLPMAAGEIREPQRNIPRALIGGMAVAMGLYLILNSSFFAVLSIEDVQQSYSNLHPDALPVATRAASLAIGSGIRSSVVVVLSIAFVISAVGAMNGSILTCARIPYAMARDGLFFKVLGRLSPHSGVPTIAVLVQGLLAGLLVFSGTWDQLTDYVVFAGWNFYSLTTASLLVLRRRERAKASSAASSAASLGPGSDLSSRVEPGENLGPYSKSDLSGAPIQFRTPFYPYLPLLFIAVSVGLLVNTVAHAPLQSVTGLALILLGIPVYFIYSARARRG